MRWLLVALLCTGCMLPSMNKEGLQLIVTDLEQARTGSEEVAEKLNAVVVELNAAAKEERSPVITEKMAAVTVALSATVESLDEAGKTAVTLQIGIGKPKPEKNLNFTPEQKDAWRNRYKMIAKTLQAVIAWGKKAMSMPAGVAGAIPKPWSGADISLLIGAIVTGAGALGIGKKKVSTWRAGAAEAKGMAVVLKEKCNGDFKEVMAGFPTTVKNYRVEKANEV